MLALRLGWARVAGGRERAGAPLPPMPVLHLRLAQRAPARAAAGRCRFTGKDGEDWLGLMLATGPRKQVPPQARIILASVLLGILPYQREAGRACRLGVCSVAASVLPELAWAGPTLPHPARALRASGRGWRVHRRTALLVSSFFPAPGAAAS